MYCLKKKKQKQKKIEQQNKEAHCIHIVSYRIRIVKKK